MEAPEVVLAPLSSMAELIDSGEICGGAAGVGLLEELRRLAWAPACRVQPA